MSDSTDLNLDAVLSFSFKVAEMTADMQSAFQSVRPAPIEVPVEMAVDGASVDQAGQQVAKGLKRAEKAVDSLVKEMEALEKENRELLGSLGKLGDGVATRLKAALNEASPDELRQTIAEIKEDLNSFRLSPQTLKEVKDLTKDMERLQKELEDINARPVAGKPAMRLRQEQDRSEKLREVAGVQGRIRDKLGGQVEFERFERNRGLLSPTDAQAFRVGTETLLRNLGRQ